MKKLFITGIIGLVLFAACSNDKQEEEQLTFADIEKEFGFGDPLSDISKQLILKKYGTIENYKLVLTNLYENKDKVKTVPWDPCTFDVQLDMPDNSVTIEVQMDEYIIDIAEEHDIDLPASCYAGACPTCVGLKVEGEVYQEDGIFLDEEDLEAGWVLTCMAQPVSDCRIKTHQEGAYYDFKEN